MREGGKRKLLNNGKGDTEAKDHYKPAAVKVIYLAGSKWLLFQEKGTQAVVNIQIIGMRA